MPGYSLTHQYQRTAFAGEKGKREGGCRRRRKLRVHFLAVLEEKAEIPEAFHIRLWFPQKIVWAKAASWIYGFFCGLLFLPDQFYFSCGIDLQNSGLLCWTIELFKKWGGGTSRQENTDIVSILERCEMNQSRRNNSNCFLSPAKAIKMSIPYVGPNVAAGFGFMNHEK